MKLSELARVYDHVSAAGSDPKRIGLLAELLRGARGRTLEAVAHLTLGELVAPQVSDKLNVGPGAIRDALARLSGRGAEEIERETRRTGDLGEVVAANVEGADKLTVDELYRRANRAVGRGEERAKLVEHVFANADPAGAKYFTRIALNQMRIGVGTGTLVRAIASAFNVEPAAVERLYAMTNDIGLAASQARRGGRALARAGLTLFRPYQFMNAHKVDDPALVFERLAGKDIIFEVKYDGARLQMHVRKPSARSRPEIRLYSRRLNDDTAAMPDVVASLAEAWRGGDAIIEGEAVAFDPTLRRRLPFQSVLMRLGRVHNVRETAREIPLVLFLFDLLYDRGEDLMNVPQSERRQRLEKLFRPTARVRMTESVVSNKRAEQDRFFKRAVRAGHEGIMAKDPDAAYTPGRRTESWMKIKPAFETLDVVITGGIYGSGRRRGLLSSLIIAVRHKDEFLTVGKVGTGFSEELLRDLTARLEPAITAARGGTVEVEPRIVIEVDFQDIQKTGRYRAGHVLRIPRFRRERKDKSTREADTLERLRRLYRQAH
ncbi:MAG TPA: ATP-dependent DNA ligase [Pyrinomonadaceae bacterium]|nr:ATP-dependent DNA ligase [Pyrinomonadaceae bacterium]